MLKAYIGTFYKSDHEAILERERKNRQVGRKAFTIFSFNNGFLVISKRQLK